VPKKQVKSGKNSPKSPKKRIKKAKRIFMNKVLAIAIAGSLVILAFGCSRLIVYVQSKPEQSEIAAAQEEPMVVSITSPVEITSAPAGAPVETRVPIETAAPVETTRAPAETVANTGTSASVITAVPPQTTAPQSVPPPAPQSVPPPQAAPATGQSVPQRSIQEQAVAVPASIPQQSAPDIVSKGKLVFVIDDAGNNLRELEPFLRFAGPLTIAVLPGLPYSVESARRIRAAGKEVFLHQPMESLGGHNPGPGAIYAGMEEDEIRSIINRNLDELWPVSGMNNHEGSKITMDERIMAIILQICRERGILFLDSRTTAETKVPAASKLLGIPIRERDVFLDNEQDRDSIMRYLNVGLERAGQRGAAIMIGHTWSPQLAPLLEELYSQWTASGFSLSTVTGLGRD
jgi:polysaccharide deacetylase 2 family uncharacterized protein YibQ